jgi:hypothetical protein
MKVQNTFKYYQDPGHGWIAVKVELLEQLGINGQISEFSYINETGTTAYLEEDCDASLFVEKYIEAFGQKPQWKDAYTEKKHWVRSYPRYTVELKK